MLLAQGVSNPIRLDLGPQIVQGGIPKGGPKAALVRFAHKFTALVGFADRRPKASAIHLLPAELALPFGQPSGPADPELV